MSPRRAVSCVLLVLVALVAATASVESQKKSKAKGKAAAKLYPTSGFLDVSDDERALTAVPFAPGAPAALLVEAQQHEWEGLDFQRVHYFRRLKVLTEAGVEDHSDFRFELRGDWRVQKVEARTLLPDGSAVDAEEGTFTERSRESGLQVINIAFPKSQVGAILDVHISVTVDAWSLTPWIVQGDLPVVRSELVMVRPPGLRFKPALFNVAEDRVQNATFNAAGGKQAIAWTFFDFEPLPPVANRPPASEIGARLVIVLDSYRDDLQYLPIAADWKTFVEVRARALDEWLKRPSSSAAALAREATAGKSSAIDKAEAIRKALRDRVRLEFLSDFPIHESADEALEKGFDSSGGITRVAMAMLKAVGVETRLAVYRRRSSGLVPAEVPIPALYNDAMLLWKEGGQDLWFCPSGDLAAGKLSWDGRGVIAVVLDGSSVEPTVTPDLKAADNRVERSSELRLTTAGSLEGTTTLTLHEAAAEQWRRRLADSDDDGRREQVQTDLRAHLPNLALASLEIENLDDTTRPLVLRASFTAEGYATRAGERLLLNPSLWSRVAAADWPPSERPVGVDLGLPYEDRDRLKLTLPPEVADVTLPEPARLNAGPVGLYEVALKRTGSTIEFQRAMKLEMYRFTAAQYVQLRRWFADIAGVDDRALALALR